MTTKLSTGFYATDTDTYYVTPSGRIWVVQSEDDLGTDAPVEVREVPEGAIEADDLMTHDEAIEHCRRIEVEGGESLIEGETDDE